MTPVPLYQKIKDDILHRIGTGDLKPGDQIPSENALVDETGASRMTVHRALRELTQDGVLQRVQGTGTFVAEPVPAADLLELRNIAEDIRAGGKTHSSRVVRLDAEAADDSIALAMELAPGSRVFHSIIVHMSDGEPVQVEDRFVNPACAPGYLDVDFVTVTPNQHLMEAAPLSDVEHIVEAVIPEPWIRDLLSIGRADPCLVLQRRTWSGGRVASFARLTHPGDKHRFGTRFSYGRDRNRPNTRR